MCSASSSIAGYGAGVAMVAATLTRHVRCLVAYEPGLGLSYPPGWIDTQERALAAGRVDDVVRAVLVDILEMREEDVDARRGTSRWADYQAGAPLLVREARAEAEWRYLDGMFDTLTTRTLFLTGALTAPALAEATARAHAAIPRGRVLRLEGHGHLAHQVDPDGVAARIVAFADE